MRLSRLKSRRLRLWAVVGFAVLAALVAVLAVIRSGPARGPAAPYSHSGYSEISVATEDVVAGQARTVVQGLSQRGYWCIQPRSNDLAVQIACQSPERDVQVDVVAAPDGDVLYADIDLGPAADPARTQDAQNRLGQVLDASFLHVWPQDRTTIQKLFEDAQPASGMPSGRRAPPVDPEEPYSTRDRLTDNASWSLWSRYTGEPLALRVRTASLQDNSWPFGSSHYAASVEAAITGLLADGFTCASSCSRASDGTAVSFEEHEGQIVAARFTLRSSVQDGEGTGPSEQWVRAGLPFLTPAVQAAVGERVEQSRREHRSWRGVVAGTPIDIVAVPGAAPMPDGRPARDLAVEIGIPLLYVE